jgi:arsenite methyltransferase
MSTTQTITDAIREKYGQTAASTLSSNDAGVRAVAEAFGYTAEELASIPAEANMGLSCGNPIALANLKPGEVVLDLGSGGGLDVFLAAAKVGPTGRAIGVDMTPDMITRARAAAARGPGGDGKPYGNVEFYLGEIDKLPLPDNSVDVIVSNCVINLATDKSSVFREMFRVLRPGGRVAVSDIALLRPLPDAIRRDVMAYVGCIAGAVSFAEYDAGLRDAGFTDVAIIDAKSDLNAYGKVEGQSACCSPSSEPAAAASSCCSPKQAVSLTVKSSSCGGSPTGHDVKSNVHEHLAELLERYDVNEYAASAKVFALKPR